MGEAAVVILAGGEARRFPGKLSAPVASQPLLLRVYARVRGHWPVYVAAKGSFSPEIDAELDCPVLVDRWPRRGPLAALLSACGEVRERFVFAVAADLPNADRSLLEELAAARRAGDEAVVPEHGGTIEPLAALYDRAALLREGEAVLRDGRGAMHELIERLQARFVPMDGERFRNVNTAADLEGVR
ncbi:MAG TPA: molybdenum cofactor guanylyltransferase [Verrucomicrobiae bacterium]|nr:molybdenum cofactor guanylyltransferase [Verrucomicrobiae bacterium]